MIVESAKPTVLIVDDMPENIDILRGILKDDKTTVYWWYSLLESIVKHKRKQFLVKLFYATAYKAFQHSRN